MAVTEFPSYRSLTGTEPVYALEITHPDLSVPVRIVNDTLPHTTEGNIYTALAFGVRLPQSKEHEIRRGSFDVDNVGRSLTSLVDTTKGLRGAKVRIMRVVRGATGASSVTSTVTWEATLLCSSVEISAEFVRIELSGLQTRGRAAVLRRADPSTTPGLF